MKFFVNYTREHRPECGELPDGGRIIAELVGDIEPPDEEAYKLALEASCPCGCPVTILKVGEVRGDDDPDGA